MTPPIRMVSVPEPDGPDVIWLEPSCCADPINGRMWCEDVAFEECDRHPAIKPTKYIRAALTAAPVREEGGAVQWGWRVRAKPSKTPSHRPWHWQADEPTGITAELCEWEPVYVALATREEAPELALEDAKAFGVGFIVDGQRVSPDRVTVCRGEEAPAEAGERKDAVVLVSAVAAGAQVDQVYGGEWCADPATGFRADLIKVLALRAHPQAREVAGPAEPEVGRVIYERIEKLLTEDPQGWERAYLSHLVASVEEVGGYDGPQAREEAQPVWRDIKGFEDRYDA